MMGLTLVIYVLLIMNISSRIVHFIKVGKSNIFLICLFITFINILNCLINWLKIYSMYTIETIVIVLQ